MQAPSVASGLHSHHLTLGFFEIWFLPGKSTEMRNGNPLVCRAWDLDWPRVMNPEGQSPPDQEGINMQLIQRKNHHRLLPLNLQSLCLNCSHSCDCSICWHIQAGLTSLIQYWWRGQAIQYQYKLNHNKNSSEDTATTTSLCCSPGSQALRWHRQLQVTRAQVSVHCYHTCPLHKSQLVHALQWPSQILSWVRSSLI